MPRDHAPNEFMLHPNAEALSKLPPDSLRAVIAQSLAEQERGPFRGSPDLEVTMGLGQLARVRDVEDVEADLLLWLCDHPTENRYDVAGLFLMGFWASPKVAAPALVDALLRGLERYPTPGGAGDSLIMALGNAHAHASNAQQLRIREVFGMFLPSRDRFQDGVKQAMDRVLK